MTTIADYRETLPYKAREIVEGLGYVIACTLGMEQKVNDYGKDWKDSAVDDSFGILIDVWIKEPKKIFGITIANGRRPFIGDIRCHGERWHVRANGRYELNHWKYIAEQLTAKLGRPIDITLENEKVGTERVWSDYGS